MLRRVFAAVLLSVLLAACGDAPTAEAPATEGESPEVVAGGQANEGGDSIELESSFDEVFAAIEGLEGQQRRDTLLAMAQEEGDLSWYTSLNSEVTAEVVDAYEEATGLGIAVYRASGEDVDNRVREEARAGVAGADVVGNSGIPLTRLAADGILQPFTSPVHDGLVEGGGREAWSATRFNIFTFAWNTNLVSEAEQPQTYQDLADPKWDGQMAMELQPYEWYWALWNYLVEEQGMTEDEADAYFQDLAEGSDFVNGHSTKRQLMVVGEYAITPHDYSYTVEAQVISGAPVAWAPPEGQPMFARPNGEALVRNAQNPAAAVTFLEWILTDGQEILADNNIDPARADLLDLGGAEVRMIDIEAYLAEEQDAIARYTELTRAGEVVEG